MEGENCSQASGRVSSDYHESIRRAMVLRGILDAPNFNDHEEQENKFSEGEDEEVEATNDVEVSRVEEIKNQEDKMVQTENTIPVREREVHESISCHQKFPGCLPYSGSVSHRSTSSTASAHSFAFPVLAEEWNSSPVRMGKADKRKSRKKKGRASRMKIGWFCCRF